MEEVNHLAQVAHPGTAAAIHYLTLNITGYLIKHFCRLNFG